MDEKIPCESCGAMILPTTAKKNGGVCMPCKQGNRENIERSKEYYKKQKEYDPFRDLWHSLVKRVHATDDAEEGFNTLTGEEKIYFAVRILDGEVYNGGMHQFFSNSSGSLYQEVIKGLELLNATNALWLVRKAAKILFGDINPPKNRFQRWEEMKQYPKDDNILAPEWSIELEKIDEQYWEDPDGINDLLVDFAETRGLVEPFKKPKKASHWMNQMNMKTKNFAFLLIFIVGGLAVFRASLEYLNEGLALAIALIWLFAFGISGIFIFRCPHCGESAIIHPAGRYVPLVGDRCRYCRKRY